jgi:hypothetical protein
VPPLTLKADAAESEPLYADTAATSPAAPKKGAPLPFLTLEGYGGGAFTPVAYLVDPPLTGSIGAPAVAVDYINLESKNLEAGLISENLFGRVELSYGIDRFDLGGLPQAIFKATGVSVRDEVFLHNFNARFLVVQENSLGSWTPAITFGAHYKYNDSIGSINHALGGALSSIGYKRDDGVDFTLTGTKAFPKVFGHPLILTAGGRASEASQIGLIGFGDQYNYTFEGSIIYLPLSNVLVAYEYRQKINPYKQIAGLVGPEDDWHGFDVSYIINDRATFVAGYGLFGTLGNSNGDASFWLQLKYEF